MQSAKFKIRQISYSLGADLFGISDITKIKNVFVLSPKVVDKFDRAISIGVRISDSILAEIEKHPTKLYYHHYRVLNTFLDQLALRLTNYIQNDGYLAIPIPASLIVDWQRQTAHLSHREIGYLAGLGWIGRNNLLVNRRFGCRFRLVTILTNLPMEADKPTREDCGNCRICIEVCPVEAIKEDIEDFEHLKCFEKLKEFQKQKLVDQYICGICLKVCRGGENG